MAKQTRNNERFTVTLTPESVEAVDILKSEWGVKATSQVIDKAIREATSALGYSIIPAREDGIMQVTLISKGTSLMEHLKDGAFFIEAPSEGNYIIRIKNNHWKKRLAVISVDGVNILNGEDAGFDGPGYMLNPWQTIDINGWHRTDKETAAFTFEALADSYAKQTGRGESNVGVIGVAVFDEKTTHDFWTESLRPKGLVASNGGPRLRRMTMGGAQGMSATNGTYGASASSAGSLSLNDPMPIAGSAPIEKVGTGYGEKMEMRTREVEFERASETPTFVLSYQYATTSTLVKWGVIKEPSAPTPNPFPAAVGVKAPPGWKG